MVARSLVNKGDSGQRRTRPSCLKAQKYCFFQRSKGIAVHPGDPDLLPSWLEGGGQRTQWMLCGGLRAATEPAVQSESAGLILCDPVDCNLPGSSVRGILQARILEWVAIFFSRGSSRPRDRICAACIGRQILYHLSYLEAPICMD